MHANRRDAGLSAVYSVNLTPHERLHLDSYDSFKPVSIQYKRQTTTTLAGRCARQVAQSLITSTSEYILATLHACTDRAQETWLPANKAPSPTQPASLPARVATYPTRPRPSSPRTCCWPRPRAGARPSLDQLRPVTVSRDASVG